MLLRSSEALERDWVDGVASNAGLVFEELGWALLLQSALGIGAIFKKEVPDDEEPPPFSARALSFLDETGDLRRLLFMLIIGFNIFYLKNIQLYFFFNSFIKWCLQFGGPIILLTWQLFSGYYRWQSSLVWLIENYDVEKLAQENEATATRIPVLTNGKNTHKHRG